MTSPLARQEAKQEAAAKAARRAAEQRKQEEERRKQEEERRKANGGLSTRSRQGDTAARASWYANPQRRDAYHE